MQTIQTFHICTEAATRSFAFVPVSLPEATVRIPPALPLSLSRKRTAQSLARTLCRWLFPGSLSLARWRGALSRDVSSTLVAIDCLLPPMATFFYEVHDVVDAFLCGAAAVHANPFFHIAPQMAFKDRLLQPTTVQERLEVRKGRCLESRVPAAWAPLHLCAC